MADTVRFYMEEMLPEMRDLEQKGIFSKVEITSILKKREKFEYALKRRVAKKADFLRYIEYEMNLEALRKKRRARMVSETKTTISDYAGPRRIHFIFKRALTKFHGDIPLWLQYINFVKKSGANKMLGKIFARAIQLHPTNADLWIMAAAWEWESNANIVAARTLLQRALRLNTTTEPLWHEYFRLELVYIAKILARREILGVETSTKEIEKEIQEKETDADNMIMLPVVTGEEFSKTEEEKDNGNDGSDKKTKKNKKSSKASKKNESGPQLTEAMAVALKTENNPVLRGDVAMVVFRSGVKEVPGSLPFRKGFLDIVYSFSKPKPLPSESIQVIYDSIKKDFDSPESRAVVARQSIDGFNVDEEGYVMGMANTVKAFWKSCEDGDPAMWEIFVDNMEVEYRKTEEDNMKLYFSKTIDKIFSTASKKNVHSEKLYLQQINWMLSTTTLAAEEASRKALALIERALEQHPESSTLLLQKIRLLRTLPRAEQVERLPATFAKALKTQHSEKYELWHEYIAFIRTAYREEDMSKEQVEEAFLDAIRITTSMLPDVTVERAEIGQIRESVPSWYMSWVFDVDGVEGVRRAYRPMVLKSLPDVSFFMTCINLEKRHSTTTAESRKAIALLYDKAIHADEKKEDTYLSYLKFLNETGQVEASNKVLWRANKVVTSKDAFSVRYNDMLEGRWHEPMSRVVDLDVNMDVDVTDDEDVEMSS